jgi:imidazolonepropionase-like amidohydrolase
VLIRDGKIVDADFHGATPAKAHEVHCEDCTLMPGLIDSHVHAFKDLELPLLFGVTTQLDMFMAISEAKPIKARMAQGANQHAADLFTAGTLVTAPGGHGTEYGLAIPTLSRPEDADAFVKARIDEGSDYIKLVYDSGTGYGMTIPTLDLPTLTAAITAAHRYHKMAVVHVQYREAGRQALEAGADGLVHLFADKPADAEFVKLAHDRGAFIVPTYAVFESFSGRNAADDLLKSGSFQGLLDDTQLKSLKQRFGKIDLSARLDMMMHDSLGSLHAAGVPILAGTDAGNPGTLLGISPHRELELLVKAGLTPTEALCAATSTPAKAFGLADRGRIATGLKADLLLVKGDPSQNILATREIVDVWKDGDEVGGMRQARIADLVARNKVATARPTVTLPANGRIAEFAEQDGKLVMHAPFGVWEPSTDSVAQGKSEVTLKSTDNTLTLDGEIKPGAMYTWAGVRFVLGDQPVNLNNVKAVRFKARGDGGQYALLAFSDAGGYIPSVSPFTARKDWHEVSIALDSLSGFNQHGAD